jgi:hypothetical protein
MKDSDVVSTKNSAGVNDECSEERCINCFTHNGCMYEHAAVINFSQPYAELLNQHMQAGKNNNAVIA